MYAVGRDIRAFDVSAAAMETKFKFAYFCNIGLRHNRSLKYCGDILDANK
jgi:hypothetical protein